MPSFDEVSDHEVSCQPELPFRGKTVQEKVMPLGKFAEQILISIHEFMNDKAALNVIRKNFAPDVAIQINKQPLNFDDFVNFVGGSRDTFSFLDVETRDTIVVPSDEEGRGGTVSLSATMTLKRKSDGHVFLVQVNEIFEITWFQLDKGQGKRFITKVFGVILSPISVDPFLASA